MSRVVVTTIAGLGMLLAALDIAVNVALPTMANALDADLESIQWVIVVFIATRASLVMGAGSFSDRFGLRTVYIFGCIAYLLSMICISLSPNLESVVGFRVLQALATGCLYAVSPAIAATVFPVEKRGLGMGFTVGSQALGMLMGTLGAGFLVQSLGWQWIFIGRIPFCVLALVLGTVFLRKQPRNTINTESFDFKGAITLVLGLMSLVIGLRLGRSIGWSSPVVLVLISLAPMFLGFLWIIEKRVNSPMLPGALVKLPAFALSTIAMFLAHFSVFVIWFVFPFYMADILKQGPLVLGLMLGTMALFNTCLSSLGGWLCDKFGSLDVGSLGLVILGAGLFLMGLLDQSHSPVDVVWRIGVVGMGLGLIQAGTYSLMMKGVPNHRFGVAGSSLSLAQALGTVMSVALIGNLFAWRISEHIDGPGGGTAGADSAFVAGYSEVFLLGCILSVTTALGFYIVGKIYLGNKDLY